MSRLNTSLLTLAVLATATLFFMVAGASAHEGRVVGDYEIEVGFLEEPALVNELNGAFVGVTRAEGGEPVEGLSETLEVEVIVGGGAARKTLPLEPLPEAGTYVARFIPSVEGDYTFRLFGEIERTAIDETFESGPGRFSTVEGIDALAIPEVTPGVSDGTGSETAQAGEDATDGTARALALAGLATGLAGLALGGVALMRRR